jgi:hypothetical protein
VLLLLLQLLLLLLLHLLLLLLLLLLLCFARNSLQQSKTVCVTMPAEHCSLSWSHASRLAWSQRCSSRAAAAAEVAWRPSLRWLLLLRVGWERAIKRLGGLPCQVSSNYV